MNLPFLIILGILTTVKSVDLSVIPTQPLQEIFNHITLPNINIFNDVNHAGSELSQSFVNSEVFQTLSTRDISQTASTVLAQFQSTIKQFADINLIKLRETVSTYSDSIDSLVLIDNVKAKLNNIPTITEKYIGALYSDAVAQVQTTFNNILEKDPRLILPTSEYAALVLRDDVQPRVSATLLFLDRSPLADNIRTTAAMPTSKLVATVADQLGPKFAPYVDAVSSVAMRVAQRISSPIAATINQITGSVTQSTDSLLSQVKSLPTDTFNVERVSIPSLDQVTSNMIPSASTFNQKVVDTFAALRDSATNRVLPTLSSAGDRFVALLQDSAARSTSGLSSAFTQYAAHLNEAVAQRAPIVGAPVPDASSTVAREALRERMKTLAEYGSLLSSQISAKSDEMRGYKFFTDPDHWENGYWEQQIKRLYSLKDLKPQDLDRFRAEVERTLAETGDRFREKSQTAIEKYDDIVRTVTVVRSKLPTSADLEYGWNTLQGSLERALVAANDFSLNEFRSSLNTYITDTARVLEQQSASLLDKATGSLQETKSSLAQFLLQKINGLTDSVVNE